MSLWYLSFFIIFIAFQGGLVHCVNSMVTLKFVMVDECSFLNILAVKFISIKYFKTFSG